MAKKSAAAAAPSAEQQTVKQVPSAAAKIRTEDEYIPESGTVTVACNIANGLQITLYDKDETDVNVLGGGVKTIPVSVPRIDPTTGNAMTIMIRGPRYAPGRVFGPGDYVLTPNVDAQFMREWMQQNNLNPLVQRKCIMVHAKPADVKSEVSDHKDDLSGLQPLKLDGDGKLVDKRTIRKLKLNTPGMSLEDMGTMQE